MQDLLTATLETIAIAYSFCLVVQFIGAIPDMQRRKYEQLSLLDELFSDSVENPAIELTAVDEVVPQLGELWVKCNDTILPDDRPVVKDSIVPFRRPLKRLGIRQLRLMARDKGLKSYSKYTKPQLLQFLQSA